MSMGLEVVLALAACVPAATPLATATPTGAPTPTPAIPANPPIITEAMAIEMGTRLAQNGSRGLSGSDQVTNLKARLMTLAEYEDRYSSGQSANDRSTPVWVVTMEGEWTTPGMVRREQSPKYKYGQFVLDARTNLPVSSAGTSAPIDLTAAVGLDPTSIPTYPLEAPLSYAREAVSFPVDSPAYVPEGFTLKHVVLDVTNPLPEAFPHVPIALQTVRLEYGDASGKVLYLSLFSVVTLDLRDGSERVSVAGHEGWQSTGLDGGTWLAWTVVYPDPSSRTSVGCVNYVLRSPDGSVSLEELHRVAETVPLTVKVGTPFPTATPAPTPTPVPWPGPTPTLTPTPTVIGYSVGCNPDVTNAVPCSSGAVVGQPYAYRLYTHCGVRQAYFDGRWWVNSPPLDDGSMNPPPGWGNPTETGVMVLVQPDLARFTTNAGGLSAEFRPAPSAYEPEGCY